MKKSIAILASLIVLLFPVAASAHTLSDQQFEVSSGQTITIDPFASSTGDFDRSSTQVSAPAHGTAVFDATKNNIRYTPEDEFIGSDSFTVTADKQYVSLLGDTSVLPSLVSEPDVFSQGQQYDAAGSIDFGFDGQTYASDFDDCVSFALTIGVMAGVDAHDEVASVAASIAAFGQSQALTIDDADFTQASFTGLSLDDIAAVDYSSFSFAFEPQAASVTFPNESITSNYPSNASLQILITPTMVDDEVCSETATATIEVEVTTDTSSGAVLGATDDQSGSVLGAADTLAATGTSTILSVTTGSLIMIIAVLSGVFRRSQD